MQDYYPIYIDVHLGHVDCTCTYGVHLWLWGAWEYACNLARLRSQSAKGLTSTRWAPDPVISGVITPTSRLITPVTQLFSAIYRGPITLLITIGSGAHLLGLVTLKKNLRENNSKSQKGPFWEKSLKPPPTSSVWLLMVWKKSHSQPPGMVLKPCK